MHAQNIFKIHLFWLKHKQQMCAHTVKHSTTQTFLNTNQRNTHTHTYRTKQTSRIIFDRPAISQNSKVTLMYANKRTKHVYSKTIHQRQFTR